MRSRSKFLPSAVDTVLWTEAYILMLFVAASGGVIISIWDVCLFTAEWKDIQPDGTISQQPSSSPLRLIIWWHLVRRKSQCTAHSLQEYQQTEWLSAAYMTNLKVNHSRDRHYLQDFEANWCGIYGERQVIAEYIGFPALLSLHRCSTPIHSSNTDAL